MTYVSKLLDEQELKINALVDAISPVAMWWLMVQADSTLCGEEPIADDAVILHFMGSGASTRVTAGQLRALVDVCATKEPA